jgi:hypothetical protein
MTGFDLRTYPVVAGRLETLQRVLRDAALPIMARHGMRAVGFWADVDGSKIYQITEHASLSVIEGDWDRLHDDPQWQIALHAIRRDRSAVREVAMARLTALPGLPPAAKHGDMR